MSFLVAVATVRLPSFLPKEDCRATEGVAFMETAVCVVLICLAALVGGGLGALTAYRIVRRQDNLNLQSAKHRAAEITEQARKEADNLRKEAELKAKDELFKKREDFNREMEHGRAELREQERRLEKREDSL